MGWYDGAYFMPLKDVLQALAIVLIWGVNFVVIKYGVADVPPLLLGALRFMLAAFPAVLLVRRPNLPWVWVAAYGSLLAWGSLPSCFPPSSWACPPGLPRWYCSRRPFYPDSGRADAA
jgi:O-acetylserine/cysteine efflux transporter